MLRIQPASRLSVRLLWGLLGSLILIFIANRALLAQSPDPGNQNSVAPPFSELNEELLEKGYLPLIVQFELPGDSASIAGTAAIDQVAIANAQQALLAQLAGYQVENVKVYSFTPHLALTLYDAEALAILYNDPNIAIIQPDIPVPPLLASSNPVIGANFAQILFYTGSGQTVAILDTGVAKNHPALAGKVVSEACFSTNNAGAGSTSLCPGGATSSIANNSGLNCAANISGCDHGTHVAGIVAGVAPGSSLISMQVFSRFTDSGNNTACSDAGRTSPCTLSFSSDQLAALNRVLEIRNSFNIASVNMSLGGGQFAGTCDFTSTLTAPIGLLRFNNIATVIAAGNSGFHNAMGSPACISSAISVAATSDNDAVASFSNLSAFTTLFAPGVDIFASVPATVFQSKNGTSMSAPHVAGAVAVLKGINPALTVDQLRDAMVNTGILVTDQRSGGFNTKRRLNVYNALCSLISCDSDDYRTVLTNDVETGSIAPANDRDHFFYQATSGTRLTIQMNRTSGSLDPYLELFNPNGTRVAVNNNGGAGNNALINNFLLTSTGRYMIVARGANANTGNYELRTSATAVQLNPVPRIDRLTPSSATGNLFANNFWVTIDGANFMSTSQARINGSLRAMHFINSNRIQIRLLGSDLGLFWPRTAFISVRNPDPGGGISNSFPFSILFPILGESNLLQPPSGTTIPTGINTTFAISWTAPISATTWRSMQNMDLRLRDENNNVAAWIRVTEHVTETSTMRLLNAAEATLAAEGTLGVDEGIPGEDNFDLVITDTVTLHLGQSDFSGSGLTAIMSPTVTFGPNAVGTYNIEFRVDGPDGEVQDEDILGVVHIVPASCPAAVVEATLNGPSEGTVGTTYNYTLDIIPIAPSQPVTITWAPEPQSGQGTTSASYSWSEAGIQSVFATVENCGGFAANVLQTSIGTGPAPDLAISKSGPLTAIAGETVTYTVTITNRGSTTATNVVVVDELPAGTTYVAGGSLVANSVTFALPELAGYGTSSTFAFNVQTTATNGESIQNSNYSVSADGGHNASGTTPVVTAIADAKVAVGALLTGTLIYPPAALAASITPDAANAIAGISMLFPQGSVFGDGAMALSILETPPLGAPSGQSIAASFRLEGYQENQALASGFVLGEEVPLTVSYSDSSIAGLDEATLTLLARNGDQWSSEGIACTVESSANQIACTLSTPTLTDYALVGSATVVDPTPTKLEMYLPRLRR